MKKKILVFTITAGGGHTAAAQALYSYLGSTYDITTLDIFKQVIKYYIIPNRYAFTDFYNDALRRQWIFFLNFCNHVVHYTFIILKPLNKIFIRRTLKKYMPDCVISVTPLVNNAVLDVAQELNIPFFLIPVDFDPRTFLYGIKNPTYDKFYIAQVAEDPEIHRRIIDKGIKENQIIHNGFIVRADFLEPKNIPAIKQTLQIPDDIPVIMILLGAYASESTYDIAQALTSLKKPCCLLICTGKNADLAGKIRTVQFPAHITVHVIEFTEKISDLMAISDMFVTKTGSNSVAEALQMNLPMIVVRFGRSLTWEAFNVHYLTDHNMGIMGDGVEGIQKAITYLLDHPDKLKSMKDAMKARKKVDLDKNIHQALTRILGNQ